MAPISFAFSDLVDGICAKQSGPKCAADAAGSEPQGLRVDQFCFYVGAGLHCTGDGGVSLRDLDELQRACEAWPDAGDSGDRTK